MSGTPLDPYVDEPFWWNGHLVHWVDEPVAALGFEVLPAVADEPAPPKRRRASPRREAGPPPAPAQP